MRLSDNRLPSGRSASMISRTISLTPAFEYRDPLEPAPEMELVKKWRSS